MKLSTLTAIAFSSVLAMSSASVFAGAITTVNNDTAYGDITADSHAESGSTANSTANSVAVVNSQNSAGVVKIHNRSNGDITSTATADGGSTANATARTVDVTASR